jgi:hypothetical protein
MDDMTITEFLLARVAEDEEAARRYSVQHWRKVDDYTVADDPGVVGTVLPDAEHGWGVARTATVRDAEFIARRDPARVLRQCDAIRRVVDRLGDYTDSHRWGNGESSRVEDALFALASIWSDHPDFDPAWN